MLSPVSWPSPWSLAGCGDDDGGGSDAAVTPNPLPTGPLSRAEAFPHEPGARGTTFYQGLCVARCDSLAACGAVPDDCVATCVDGLVADALSVATVACDAVASCANADRCASPAAPPAQCEDLCDAVADCAAFPNSALGADRAECLALCGGTAAAGEPSANASLQCTRDAWRDHCAAGGTGQCHLPSVGPQDTCFEVCQREVDCGLIPGPRYLTLPACLDACRATPLLDQLQVSVCTSIAGCERFDRCTPADPATPEACATFCPAWLDACPNGGINSLACDAICRAVLQAGPGFDMVGGAACIEASEGCPANEALLACITPAYPGCDTICARLEACGVNRAECDGFCPTLAALEPDNIATMQTCADTADCTVIGACFE